jgi:polyhydroxybutyrate depolymerase
MRAWLLTLSLACLLPASPASQAQESLRDRLKARMEQRRAERGNSAPAALQELKVQGRKVLVHVPATLDPAQPAPLVLALHGGGGHAEFMADDAHYALQKKADEAGFIVAFPNGYSKLPGEKFATWNAGGCCGDARDRGVDDVAFARAVVAAVQARWRVDAARVFATGMSNGGMMSHRLACEAADVFRAVASVAGTDATDRCTPSRPISVLHIHARDDTHVLFDGGAGPGAFRDTSKVMNFVSVPETVARWVARDRCSGPARRTLDVPGAFCEVHAGCADGREVQLCVTETGGHSWPGAPTVRRGKPGASTALDANDVIWRFFEQASR